MSSKEAMPEDVRMVEEDNGEGRVPGRWSTVLELVFLLKVDINRRTGGGGRKLSSHLILIP
jgi:hypothetical protein